MTLLFHKHYQLFNFLLWIRFIGINLLEFKRMWKNVKNSQNGVLDSAKEFD